MFLLMACTSEVRVADLTLRIVDCKRFFFRSGDDLQIDEASMTGEQMPVRKDSHHPFLLAGCTVSEGSGVMLVTAVGVSTEWGRTLQKVLATGGDVDEVPAAAAAAGAADGKAPQKKAKPKKRRPEDSLTPLQRALGNTAEMITFVGRLERCFLPNPFLVY